MAAAIVYDGVEGKYEGTLFNGIKFWVAQRVPTRSSIVGKIKDNGGKIVLLEKHADVLIADHARKDCPAGSVSWKYIEESVARGELLDIGDYRIHAANIPRAVGSTRPTKGTRVPFTELDERILVTWVRRAGADALGNRIYQELAEMYPHHTWQSWRDKWVKKFSFLSEDQLPPLLQELPPSKPRPQGGGSRSTPHIASPPAVPAVNQPDVDPIPGSRPAGAKRGRVAFTKEDDRLLVEYVMQRMMAGKSPGGNVIYQELENEVIPPSHGSCVARSILTVFVTAGTSGGIKSSRFQQQALKISSQTNTARGTFNGVSSATHTPNSTNIVICPFTVLANTTGFIVEPCNGYQTVTTTTTITTITITITTTTAAAAAAHL
ncbi:hypothetical protein VTI28DRAFT_6603 [Corynascus sepedonium]